MISIEKLSVLMKSKGVGISSLKTNRIVGGQSYTNLANMVKGKMTTDGLTLGSINAICRYLNCQPGDIMEYVDDDVSTDERSTHE